MSDVQQAAKLLHLWPPTPDLLIFTAQPIASMEVVGILTVFRVATYVIRGLDIADGCTHIFRRPATLFLYVFDVPQAVGKDANILIDIVEYVTGKHMEDRLHTLPVQEPGSYRFYVGENVNHVAFHSPGRPSFTALRSQWHSPTSLFPWLSRSFAFPDTRRLGPAQIAPQ